MIDRAALGAALRSARNSSGMSVATAAEQIGCSERHIRRLEKLAPLNIEHIEALCAVYGVHPVSVISKGYRKNVEVIHTANLSDDCKKLLQRVVDAFAFSAHK